MTHIILFSECTPIYASSCMTISGGRTKQLDIIAVFCRITGFKSDGIVEFNVPLDTV